MKTSFYTLLFLLVAFYSLAEDVCSLYTPKGTEIYVRCSIPDISQPEKDDIRAEFARNYPQAVFLSDATPSYNCHSYAWNMTEGGDTCWLNQASGLHYYWNDGSYVISSENQATKIFYYNGDHSAIRSLSTSGKYESKWGPGPLMRHSPTYGPAIYSMSHRRYYMKKHPSVTVGSYPSSVSPNSYYQVSQSNTDGFKRQVLITANTTNSSDGFITLGSFQTGQLSGQGTVPIAIHSNAVYDYGQYPYIRVIARYNNGYGFYTLGNYVDIYCPNCTFKDSGPDSLLFVAYPNPVFDVLNIKYDKVKSEQDQMISKINVRQLASDFDVRLYDAFGRMLRSVRMDSEDVQINVSNLPKGYYYLHIYDRNKDKVEMQQIIMKK